MLLGIIFLTYSFTYCVGLLINRTSSHTGLRLTMYDLELLITLPHPSLCSAELGTQGLVNARQTLYQLNYIPTPGVAFNSFLPSSLVHHPHHIKQEEYIIFSLSHL